MLNNNTCYINELTQEQQFALQNFRDFVVFLCYRHIDTSLAQSAIENLQVMVHHDPGLCVHKLSRDISWDILGICQQIAEKLQVALYSYQK